MGCTSLTFSHRDSQGHRNPGRRPGPCHVTIWNLARLWYIDFDIEAWTSMYVYAYIEVPNFDIEALRYRARYWSPISKFLTSISKSLISQSFNIEDFKLLYRSTSILKILRYWSKLRYRSNPISKITLILKLKFIYRYRSHLLRYRSFCYIEAILHRILIRYWSWNSYTDIEVL